MDNTRHTEIRSTNWKEMELNEQTSFSFDDYL